VIPVLFIRPCPETFRRFFFLFSLSLTPSYLYLSGGVPPCSRVRICSMFLYSYPYMIKPPVSFSFVPQSFFFLPPNLSPLVSPFVCNSCTSFPPRTVGSDPFLYLIGSFPPVHFRFDRIGCFDLNRSSCLRFPPPRLPLTPVNSTVKRFILFFLRETTPGTLPGRCSHQFVSLRCPDLDRFASDYLFVPFLLFCVSAITNPFKIRPRCRA